MGRGATSNSVIPFLLARLFLCLDFVTLFSKILSGLTPPTITLVGVFLPKILELSLSSSSKSQETGFPKIGSIHLFTGLNWIYDNVYKLVPSKEFGPLL